MQDEAGILLHTIVSREMVQDEAGIVLHTIVSLTFTIVRLTLCVQDAAGIESETHYGMEKQWRGYRTDSKQNSLNYAAGLELAAGVALSELRHACQKSPAIKRALYNAKEPCITQKCLV